MSNQNTHIKMGVVNDSKIPDSPPPVDTTGALAWVKSNLFGSVFHGILTIITLGVVLYMVPSIIDWTLISAVWTGGSEACRANTNGACWPFIAARWEQFLYGQYINAERWRIDLGLWLLTIGILFLVFEETARKAGKGQKVLIGLTIASSVLFINLIFKNEGSVLPVIFGLAIIMVTSYIYWMKPNLPAKSIIGVFMLTVYPIIAYFLMHGGTWVDVAFIFIRIFAIIAVGYVCIKMIYPKVNQSLPEPLNLIINVLATILLLYVAMKIVSFTGSTLNDIFGKDSGLINVPTNRWGGFTLTLVIALTGIVASLPLGVLLALGRRSTMPVIRLISTIFIEFWRGVPLITVLFMASVMFPLFVPPDVTIDQLLRALIGVALFSAAYMAEVVRGGLQAIPKGQYEGAMALGISYWRMMGLIIMPQALKVVIPGIVNTFIGLFKDTTLVLIIGLLDLLNTVQSSMSDPNWLIYTVPYTGYVFVAFIFFVFCYGMARYSRHLEEKLHTGHKR